MNRTHCRIPRCLRTATLTACLLSPAAPAVELGKDLDLHGTVSIEDGLVIAGKYIGDAHQGDFENIWLPRSTAIFSLMTSMSPRKWLHVEGMLQPELQAWMNTFKERWTRDISDYRFKTNYSFYLQNAYGQVSLGSGERPWLGFTAGTFLFKYNSAAANLGEYLFRTGCYPGNIINDFDFASARLTGLRLSSTLLGCWRQDLFFTREQEIEPLHDWSLSYVTGIDIRKILDVGAGVSWWRLLPSDDSATTPRFPVYTSYRTGTGDTGYYSFSGTKLMAHATFDFKPIFGTRLSTVFGREDFKIFGEAAILGTRDYPIYRDSIGPLGDTSYIPTTGYYDTLWQRIPVMFGINAPSPSLLFRPLSLIDNKVVRAVHSVLDYLLTFDVISVQGEWYGSPWPIGPYCKKYDEIVWPTPPLTDGVNVNPYSLGRFDYHRDDWKWSVYAKKTLVGQFSLTGQVARDHLKHRVDRVKFRDEQDMLPKSRHWYWAAKLGYSF